MQIETERERDDVSEGKKRRCRRKSRKRLGLSIIRKRKIGNEDDEKEERERRKETRLELINSTSWPNERKRKKCRGTSRSLFKEQITKQMNILLEDESAAIEEKDDFGLHLSPSCR